VLSERCAEKNMGRVGAPKRLCRCEGRRYRLSTRNEVYSGTGRVKKANALSRRHALEGRRVAQVFRAGGHGEPIIDTKRRVYRSQQSPPSLLATVEARRIHSTYDSSRAASGCDAQPARSLLPRRDESGAGCMCLLRFRGKQPPYVRGLQKGTLRVAKNKHRCEQRLGVLGVMTLRNEGVCILGFDESCRVCVCVLRALLICAARFPTDRPPVAGRVYKRRRCLLASVGADS
jgi:hypothetical protein